MVEVGLQTLLDNMNKTKMKKSFVKHFGRYQKAEEFQKAITELNTKYNTSYYMERDGRSFTIQGHREFGKISRRNGILGKDVSLTIDLKDIEKAGSEHTVKMIVDNNANWMVFSLRKMLEVGLIDIHTGKRFRTSHDGYTYQFCIWELSELERIGAILYKSI